MSHGGISPVLTPEEAVGLLDLTTSLPTDLELDAYRESTIQYLMAVFHAHAGNFFLRDRHGEGLNLDSVCTVGLDRQTVIDYKHYYQYLDPFLRVPLDGFKVHCISEFLPEDKLLNSELYNDFLKRQEVRHALCFALSFLGKCIGLVALFRTPEQVDFTPIEKEKAASISPYLSRSWHRAILSERNRQLKWLLCSILDDSEAPGIMFLEADLNPIYLNSIAGQMLATPTVKPPATAGPQSVSGSSLPEELACLCARHMRASLSGFDVPPAVLDVNGSSVRVTLKKGTSRFFGEQKSHLIVKLEKVPASGLKIDPSLAKRFNLTPREVEVVQEISEGCSARQIARKLFISPHTVQNHIANAFAKVGARNRMELLGALVR